MTLGSKQVRIAIITGFAVISFSIAGLWVWQHQAKADTLNLSSQIVTKTQPTTTSTTSTSLGSFSLNSLKLSRSTLNYTILGIDAAIVLGLVIALTFRLLGTLLNQPGMQQPTSLSPASPNKPVTIDDLKMDIPS